MTRAVLAFACLTVVGCGPTPDQFESGEATMVKVRVTNTDTGAVLFDGCGDFYLASQESEGWIHIDAPAGTHIAATYGPATLHEKRSPPDGKLGSGDAYWCSTQDDIRQYPWLRDHDPCNVFDGPISDTQTSEDPPDAAQVKTWTFTGTVTGGGRIRHAEADAHGDCTLWAYYLDVGVHP